MIPTDLWIAIDRLHSSLTSVRCAIVLRQRRRSEQLPVILSASKESSHEKILHFVQDDGAVFRITVRVCRMTGVSRDDGSEND